MSHKIFYFNIFLLTNDHHNRKIKIKNQSFVEFIGIESTAFNSKHPWENKTILFQQNILFLGTKALENCYVVNCSCRCRQESSMGQTKVHIGKRCSLNSWILKYMEKLIKWELIRIGLISIVCKRKQSYVLGADHDV